MEALIVTLPGDGIGTSDTRCQAVRYRAKKIIAGLMAEGVINTFKVVKV